MKKIVFVLGLLLASSFALAQDDEAKPIKVANGIVVIDKISYPVYTGIKEVEQKMDQGIKYSVIVKKAGDAPAGVKKIIAFYGGKKIGSIVLPKNFKPVKEPKPGQKCWYAKAGGGDIGKGAGVVIRLNDNQAEIFVDVLNNTSGVSMITYED